MLGEIISGIGKNRDDIRIICGRRKSKFEFIANEEMRTVLDCGIEMSLGYYADDAKADSNLWRMKRCEQFSIVE